MPKMKSRQLQPDNEVIRNERQKTASWGGIEATSPDGEHLQTIRQIIKNSPRQAVQRKRISALFGGERGQAAQQVNDEANRTGMPDDIKSGMEKSFNTDFSDVRIQQNSSRAGEVGALAYTQRNQIHFAPGLFNPDTSDGKSLLGHELTHVVQQRQGRVQATTEINGVPVNDNPALEKEADELGRKASRN